MAASAANAAAKRMILVTGGNAGIGFATCRMILDEAKDTAVLLGSRDAAKGADAVKELLAEKPEYNERVHLLEIDVCDDSSVIRAADEVREKYAQGNPQPLYAVVNNAGVGFNPDTKYVLNVNAYGARRVCDAFLPLVQTPGGRICNVSSASGGMFMSGTTSPKWRSILSAKVESWAEIASFLEAYQKVREDGSWQDSGLKQEDTAYGASKAALTAYTFLLAKQNPTLIVSACTPGFINTKLVSGFLNGRTPAEAGMKSPDEGQRPQKKILFDANAPTGVYLGSDALRSPIDKYRGPGDEEYTGSYDL